MSGLFGAAQSALEAKLDNLSGKPAIAWENVAYVPVQGTTYIQPSNLSAASTIATLASLQDNRGIFQIDVYTPAEKGTKAANTLVDAIYNHFHAAKLTSGSAVVEIGAINPKHVGRDGAWWKSMIEINYRYYSS